MGTREDIEGNAAFLSLADHYVMDDLYLRTIAQMSGIPKWPAAVQAPETTPFGPDADWLGLYEKNLLAPNDARVPGWEMWQVSLKQANLIERSDRLVRGTSRLTAFA